MQYIAAPRRRTAAISGHLGSTKTKGRGSPRLWKPCRFTVLEMCLSISIYLMSNTCLQTWKIKDKCVCICRQHGHEINLRWFVVHIAHVAYESSNMHVHQSSQISGQGKTCTDYWEYMFKKTIAQSNHSKYCVFYYICTTFFLFPSLSLSPSPRLSHIHNYHSKSSGNQNEYTTSHSRWSSWLCSKVWRVLSWSESHPFSLFSPTARPKMPRQSRNLRLADVWPVSTIFGKCVLVIVSYLN